MSGYIPEYGLYVKDRLSCFSVAGSKSDKLFLWVNLREHVSAIPPPAIAYLQARLQAVVTEVLADVVRPIAVCLETDGGFFEHLF
jgi:hypothetical protein